MAFVGVGGVGSAQKTARKVCSVRPKANGLTRTKMAMEEPEKDKIADFTSVDFADASTGFEGIVFSAESVDLPETRVNMNYSKACEDVINTQINVEYTASYVYHAMFAYFNRDTVGLPGFAKYFKDMSDEEREHAEKLMEYQNARGGRVELKPVAVPEMAFTYVDGTSDAIYAMDLHLQLEKFVYDKIMQVHKVAEKNDDPQLCDYMESFLTDQVKAVKNAADYVAQLKRVGTGHGVYHIDTQLLEGKTIPVANFELA